jgi:catalase
MTLNRNVDNFFAETESVGFNPGVLVPGIQPSEDKMLQGRLFSYSDTQRYRIGANYLQLPINAPKCPFSNNQRDGAMPFGQQMSRVNYEPNSFDSEPKEAPEFKEFDQPISGVAGKNAIEKTNNFGQAGEIYRSYDESTKQALIKNLLDQFSGIENRDIVGRVIANLHRADESLGHALAEGSNVDVHRYL